MALLLPGLRADFTIHDTYVHRPGTILSCPITVFGGHDDPSVPLDSLHAWPEHTTGRVDVRLFAGDHFFIRTAVDEVVTCLADLLTQIDWTITPSLKGALS